MNEYFEKAIDCLVQSIENQNKMDRVDLSFLDKEQYPKSLYKYRDCNAEYNFDMLENQYLWADKPESFLDPNDSLISYDFDDDVLLDWSWKWLPEIVYYCLPPKGMCENRFCITLQSLKNTKKLMSDENGRYDKERAGIAIQEDLKTRTPKEQALICLILETLANNYQNGGLEAFLNETVETALAEQTSLLQRTTKVCCITKRRDNRKMWEDYADKYSGFIIEYAIKENCSVEKSSLFLRLFPVEYYEEKPKLDMIPFVRRSFAECTGEEIDLTKDIRKLYEQLFLKSYDYRTEEEWRIVYPENKIPFPFVLAVYAGYKITEENLNRLKDICERKGYALYKQKFNKINGNMEYETIIAKGE